MADAQITKSVRWRIYRLPGSREVWHVDSGPGTHIVNVRGFEIYVPCRSIDVGGDNVPRAWIEIAEVPAMRAFPNQPLNADFYIVGGIAVWVAAVSVLPDAVADAVAQP